jgi:hypothetical protein
MTNADRAANFLVALGNQKGGIEEFVSTFADHIHSIVPLENFGTIVTFLDSSTLVRVPRPSKATLLFHGTRDEVGDDLIIWAIENNKIEDLLNAIKKNIQPEPR